MRFAKVLWFDLKNGWLKVPQFFLYPVFLSIFSFMEVRRKTFFLDEEPGIGDYWMHLYGGMREYIPEPGNAFVFPAIWMILFLLGSFLVLHYPLQDLHSVGTQILIRTKGRSSWWLSKCCWNVIASFTYHGMILLTLILLCAVFQVPFRWELTTSAITSMFGLFVDEVPTGGVPYLVLVLPIVLVLSLNLFQMFLTLFMKPIFSFLCSSAMFLVSAYWMSPIALGNYGMVLRMNWATEGGVDPEKGILIFLVIGMVSVVGGLIRFRRMDIINEQA